MTEGGKSEVQGEACKETALMSPQFQIFMCSVILMLASF